MKSLKLLLVAALLAGSSGGLGWAVSAAETASPPEASPPAGMQEVIEKIGPGVWVIRQREPFHLQPSGNITVIEQRNGLVLIDGSGSPGAAHRVIPLIKSVSSKPVKAIAITHWHGDHSLGVATLLQTWPKARVIATKATRDHILGESMAAYPKGKPDAAMTQAFIDSVKPFVNDVRELSVDQSLPEPVRAAFASGLIDVTYYQQHDIQGVFLPTDIGAFARTYRLPDPTHPVELRFLGLGNTDGDLIAWLPRQRIVASGDLVVAPVPFGFGSYPASWQSDLDKLIALHPRVLVPGHGLPMKDLSYVRTLRDMLRDTRARMATIGPKMELAAAKKEIAPYFAPYEKRIAGDDPWLQRWFVRYWRSPISEALWKESRGVEIKQGKG